MKKRNGFTLVEVMVTVAVMGVLAGIVGITMGVLLGQRVKSMAADTKSVFQSTQIAAMSRDDAYIVFKQNGSDAEVVAYSSAGNKISSATAHNVSMTLVFNGSDEVNPSSEVTVHFNRQTGGLKPQSAGEGGDAGSYLSAIILRNGNREIRLRISKLTGKVTY